jgi:hypothetical protein
MGGIKDFIEGQKEITRKSWELKKLDDDWSNRSA